LRAPVRAGQISAKMKAALAAILLAAAWAGPAKAATQGLEHISVGGEDYVRLAEWADSNGFKMIWPGKDDPIELTNQSASLRFATDSRAARKAQIGGTTILLSLPVIVRGGAALISMSDVQKSLEPVLFPKKSPDRVRTICLDPGHGGVDKGEIDGENFEKKYSLLLAQATQKLLQNAGFKVVLTRTNDVYVDLAERPAAASRAGADLFVSLHYNSGPKGVRGVEVHCLPPAGMNSSNGGGGRGHDPAYAGNAQDDRNILLAYEELKSITGKLPLEDIGVKRSHLEVLREAHVPAILIEGGFMTDPQDSKKIYDADFRQRMAQSIVSGILAYKAAVEEKPGDARVAGVAIKPPSH
jgi:N-acetylmuramoyl-L-alanine amidase